FSSRRTLSISSAFPYTTLFRSTVSFQHLLKAAVVIGAFLMLVSSLINGMKVVPQAGAISDKKAQRTDAITGIDVSCQAHTNGEEDRKSTRLNSSHQIISYAVFC